ncbi:MAG: carbamoyl-phosphate synthase large subunit [Sulfobacillus benefaciens]|uniref:Carbamoyl phosphate synthase large chain n=1 Tax=Sulfobacillus benefaciens TaxID=453960 RepID=A0A2T2XE74_9FIRM|nr:MAG: carbamoyl-phosphate synthase large subunit [Sulfobacillus benefaciens]
MPRDTRIKKVLVIGSGPIIIGQAAEFDYAGTQACRALKEEGLEVVLVNSNPATIMTDLSVADIVYVEPLTVSFLAYILGKERPDGILATLGGQMGLNLTTELFKAGILTDLGVQVLGTSIATIEKAEDREAFRRLMLELGHPIATSRTVTTLEEGLEFAAESQYPLVLRPAYTLGGSGGGFVYDDADMQERLPHALALSPIGQVLVEESIAGFKEVEYEVIRDSAGNAITVCNMENFDPVGVHTGDSIVVAPSQTLTDKEYQMLRSASLDIVHHLGVEGGCNVQFALHPDGRYRVIEVNPRVSRSSALASKATGYPIARVVSKIAVGLTLPEIPNSVTGTTTAAFEPALDYVVAKIPRWPFDKFATADRHLGTQMKATGEVMAIDRTFTAALQKAVRSLEIKRFGLSGPKEAQASLDMVWDELKHPTDERLFYVAEALRRGITVEAIHEATQIDRWFLHQIEDIVHEENWLRAHSENWSERLGELKEKGFADRRIAELVGKSETAVREERLRLGIRPQYKMVDTCAGEFPAATPYFYATYDQENEAEPLPGPKVLVLGSGPIRIGQGIEFDAASVYALEALRELGYRAIMLNNNPETVSTDFNASDRLYFEPLTLEDVFNVILREKPDGVMVQFGGQTAINLAEELDRLGVPILGTSIEGIRGAEDREQFDKILEKHGIMRPPGRTATTAAEAMAAAQDIGYPVLVRPSYVLGGRAMEIVDDAEGLADYLQRTQEMGPGQPLLIDRYMNGLELEVDAVSDGIRVAIPAIMEHVERAGIHSGDSVAALPPIRASHFVVDRVVSITEQLCQALNVRGLLNVQFVAVKDQVYVIEANPRASRTVPFIIKATGAPMVKMAIEAAVKGSLSSVYRTGLWPSPDHFAVKMPVFSFGKLNLVDAALGPEMKSTGEVMGIDQDFPSALYKALIAGGFRLPAGGKILVTIADQDKTEALPYLEELARLGYRIYATTGTLALLSSLGIPATPVYKLGERRPHLVDLIRQGQFNLVINTITVGGDREREGFLIRRAAVERGVLCFTSLDTVAAALEALRQRSRQAFGVHSLNEWLVGRSVKTH